MAAWVPRVQRMRRTGPRSGGAPQPLDAALHERALRVHGPEHVLERLQHHERGFGVVSPRRGAQK
ncbi:protein of unknown function (plasmid) [Caballeronia sp. S22]